jgi:hypothetical protein
MLSYAGPCRTKAVVALRHSATASCGGTIIVLSYAGPGGTQTVIALGHGAGTCRSGTIVALRRRTGTGCGGAVVMLGHHTIPARDGRAIVPLCCRIRARGRGAIVVLCYNPGSACNSCTIVVLRYSVT